VKVKILRQPYWMSAPDYRLRLATGVDISLRGIGRRYFVDRPLPAVRWRSPLGLRDGRSARNLLATLRTRLAAALTRLSAKLGRWRTDATNVPHCPEVDDRKLFGPILMGMG
jgi:hypothetical protein